MNRTQGDNRSPEKEEKKAQLGLSFCVCLFVVLKSVVSGAGLLLRQAERSVDAARCGGDLAVACDFLAIASSLVESTVYAEEHQQDDISQYDPLTGKKLLPKAAAASEQKP